MKPAFDDRAPPLVTVLSSKVPTKETLPIILHHDNASFHTAAVTLQYLAENEIRVIKNSNDFRQKNVSLSFK